MRRKLGKGEGGEKAVRWKKFNGSTYILVLRRKHVTLDKKGKKVRESPQVDKR